MIEVTIYGAIHMQPKNCYSQNEAAHKLFQSVADDLINSIRGIQQFAAARSNRSFIGTGDARQEEASLDLLVPNSTQVQCDQIGGFVVIWDVFEIQ